MPKYKHYYIENKTIYADVPKLTKTEAKAVKGYLLLDYNLVEKTIVIPDEVIEKEKETNPYTQVKVEAFLNEKGNEEIKKEYINLCNQQAGTNRVRKQKDGSYVKIEDEPKWEDKLKTIPKKKGFIVGLKYFMSVYEFSKDANTYIKKENK